MKNLERKYEKHSREILKAQQGNLPGLLRSPGRLTGRLGRGGGFVFNAKKAFYAKFSQDCT